MRIKKWLASAVVLSVFAGVFAGCSMTEEAPAGPDYTELTASITEYEDSYRSFVQEGEGEVAVVTATGTTPLGAQCSSVYTCSSDGRFESCSLTVQRDVEQHDEYFHISDDMMMFVRSYIDAAGLIVIQKYVTLSNGSQVFYIDDEAQTVTPVTDLSSLDCFVTFDQVRRAYGPEDKTTT